MDSARTPPRRRPSPGWAVRAALLVAIAGSSPAARAGDAAPPSVSVPTGIPVQVDGALAPAEWSDAAQVTLEPGGVILRIKQVRGTLLLGLSSDRPWMRGAHLMVFVAPDLPESNALAPEAATLDYEPLDHKRPHLMVRRGSDEPAPDLAQGSVVRARVHHGAPVVEMAIQLPALGVTGRTPPSRRIAVALTRAAGGDTATWPAGLDVGASPGKPPADLLSSARWARLTGFVDADGPGALSKADWQALKAEDDLLAEKGYQAHMRAFELLEEGGRKVEKQDAVIEREVLEPLAWIAAREPLDPYDLLVKGQVLRMLNRYEAALATLEALSVVRETEWRESVTYERARALASLERHEEEAEAWRAAGEAVPPEGRARYEGAAARALEAAKRRDAERAARREDEADPASPLVLLTTERGAILLCLHAKDVPQAVAHFLRLVEQPAKDGGRFYDGTLFHRVVGDAFAQGGDPRTRSDGCDADLSGPASATIPVETNARHGFFRGSLAFARAGQPQNANQFFLVVAPQPGLEKGGYTVFGHVVAGQQVVDRLERCDRLLSARVLRGLPPAPPGPAPAAPAEAPTPR